MSSLLEVALSGNEEQKPFDYKLRPEIAVFVDLALGCTKEPARSLWISMQDYAVSKGKMRRTREIEFYLPCKPGRLMFNDTTVFKFLDTAVFTFLIIFHVTLCASNQ